MCVFLYGWVIISLTKRSCKFGARRSYVVRWVVGSFPPGGPIKICFVPPSIEERDLAHGAMGRRINPSWWTN